MKFFIDNNLPPAIARALDELTKDAQVTHLREKFDPGTDDLTWITQLKREGHWVVVSNDRFAKNDLEKEAFYESDILVFRLAKGWANLDYWTKSAKLVHVWPILMKQAGLITGGGVFEVTVAGKLKQIKLG